MNPEKGNRSGFCRFVNCLYRTLQTSGSCIRGMGVALCLVLIFTMIPAGCRNSEGARVQEIVKATPVTVTKIHKEKLNDFVFLTATSFYLSRTSVKSTVTGFITDSYKKINDPVRKGDALFRIETKEAHSLGNLLQNVDTSFRFHGVTVLYSPENGIISQLDYASGDYIQDGEVLAEINRSSSFFFVLNLPYEYKPLLPHDRKMSLLLPDSTQIEATIDGIRPQADLNSQTIGVLLRTSGQNIPENLIASVHLLRQSRVCVQVLPRNAILSNETMDKFWVMKMIDDSTAVKIWVHKGLETATETEITAPQFLPDDRILLTGNYGLPDTARVIIEKP